MTDHLTIAIELLLSRIELYDGCGSSTLPTQGRVRELLVRVAALGRKRPGSGDSSGLWALCRKIHVDTELYVAYDTDWRHPSEQTALPEPHRTALAAALLALAAHYASDEDGGRGAALKALNAVYYLLDERDGGLEIPDVAAIRNLADRMLSKMVSS